jgi:hypothetical protein
MWGGYKIARSELEAFPRYALTYRPFYRIIIDLQDLERCKVY